MLILIKVRSFALLVVLVGLVQVYECMLLHEIMGRGADLLCLNKAERLELKRWKAANEAYERLFVHNEEMEHDEVVEILHAIKNSTDFDRELPIEVDQLLTYAEVDDKLCGHNEVRHKLPRLVARTQTE